MGKLIFISKNRTKHFIDLKEEGKLSCWAKLAESENGLFFAFCFCFDWVSLSFFIVYVLMSIISQRDWRTFTSETLSSMILTSTSVSSFSRSTKTTNSMRWPTSSRGTTSTRSFSWKEFPRSSPVNRWSRRSTTLSKSQTFCASTRSSSWSHSSAIRSCREGSSPASRFSGLSVISTWKLIAKLTNGRGSSPTRSIRASTRTPSGRWTEIRTRKRGGYRNHNL